MNKPQFMCKLLRNLNNRDSIQINPQSPLFINKKHHQNRQNYDQSPSNSMSFSAQNKESQLVNVQKQSEDKESETRVQKLEKFGYFRKYESTKLPTRRVMTLPSNSQEKERKSIKSDSVQINPALMIRELKLNSLGHYSGQQNNVGKKLEQIQIRLGWGSIRKKFINKQNLTNRANILNQAIYLSQNQSGFKSTKTANNFRKQGNRSTQRKQSEKGNFKITTQPSLSKLKQRKMLSLSLSKPFLPPPKITAKSFIVYKTSSKDRLSQVLFSSHSKSKQEIASLTKVMTAILIIEICRLISVDIYAEEVTITTFQEGIPGTTASIKEGEVYTIEQLLHGLMLPSGNDASVALAVWGGLKLLQYFPEINAAQLKQDDQTRSRCYRRFIKEMNTKAASLKMRTTSYMNSHGLSNNQSKSCAFDMVLLCEYCMKNETFRNIVSCPRYSSTIRICFRFRKNEGRRMTCSSLKKIKIEWQNTHELVRRFPDQYIGIKTGFTHTAGPCLASCLILAKTEYLIVLLGCESMSMRFRDTEVLRKWVEGQTMNKNL